MRPHLANTLYLIFAFLMVVPGVAGAGPITNIEVSVGEDVYLVHEHWTSVLTPEVLATLGELDDQGWHLGWFKKKTRGDADLSRHEDAGERHDFTNIDPSVGDLSDPASAALSPLSSIAGLQPELVLSSAAPFTRFSSATSNIESNVSQIALVPEPASMTLLGIGLAGLGALKSRQRRNRLQA